MATKAMIMFPYGGYSEGDLRGELFWSIVEACRGVIEERNPLVILNRDTERRKKADAFLNDPRTKMLVDI